MAFTRTSNPALNKNTFQSYSVTGEAETTDNNMDICAAGEGPTGVAVSFPPQYEIGVDSANDWIQDETGSTDWEYAGR